MTLPRQECVMAERLEPAHEAALIERARRDPAAFQELYRHYLPRVYAYVAARLPERAEAEDVVATAFLKAFERLHQFRARGDGSFAAWLFQIAHRGLLDDYRQRRRRGTPHRLERHHDLADEAEPLDVAVIRAEAATNLRRLITTLPPRRQEVVALRFFAGLRNHEIAAVLGIHERSVASHLCRALDDLQRTLHSDEAAHSGEGRK
jgi:RNA polymerase sigma-70 factor (ECF subfamily)